jgi:hypothetical protein
MLLVQFLSSKTAGGFACRRAGAGLGERSEIKDSTQELRLARLES